MNFTIVIKGAVPPSGNGPKRDTKWQIREQVDRQMRELWLQEPLNSLDNYRDKAYRPNNCYLGKSIGIFEGIAPVSSKISTYCNVDITFLDPSYGEDISIGDVDNMAKTIIDGLTLPSQKPPPGTFIDKSADGRVYGVMDDDRLVRQVSYRMDRLLGMDNDRSLALAIVAIQIAAQKGTMANLSVVL